MKATNDTMQVGRNLVLKRTVETLSCVDEESIRTLSYAISRLERDEAREINKVEKLKMAKERLIFTRRLINEYRIKCTHPIAIKLVDEHGEEVCICPFCRKEVESNDSVDLTFIKWENTEQAIWEFREFINTVTQVNPNLTKEELLQSSHLYFEELKRTLKKSKKKKEKDTRRRNNKKNLI